MSSPERKWDGKDRSQRLTGASKRPAELHDPLAGAGEESSYAPYSPAAIKRPWRWRR